MLLQRLREYGAHLPGTPTLYNEAPLRYVVELSSDGRLLKREPTDRADPGSPATKRGTRHSLPQIVRASGVKPLLLADKADYALGYVGPDANPDRVRKAHAAFLQLVRACEEATGVASVAVVRRFLESEPLALLDLGGRFDASATMTFRVGDDFPIDDARVQRFWANVNDPAQKDARVMQCLVCGEERPAVERLQLKIKGVPGGQMAGTSIISANEDAFESYGLRASLVAPTCAPCGEEFTKAANHLLANDQTCVRTGGVAFIFWTREPITFSLRGTLIDADPEQVKRLILSPITGQEQRSVAATRFFATSLSASGGRTVVRDWVDTTVGDVQAHVRQWFARQEIVDAFGQPHRPLGLRALEFATVREPRDVAVPTTRALLRAALIGTPLPLGLLHRVNLRNQAEREVNRQRASLTRLILNGIGALKEGDMIQLDTETTNAAYRCGRLFAVLEQAQRLAIPGIKATIVNRFYGTASTSPVAVFGRLTAGAQPHLAKLRRDKKWAYFALQARIEEILGGLPLRRAGGKEVAYPKTLTPTDQGLFALGYYHQRASDRAQAIAAKARREAGETAPEADLLDALVETNDDNEEEA